MRVGEQAAGGPSAPPRAPRRGPRAARAGGAAPGPASGRPGSQPGWQPTPTRERVDAVLARLGAVHVGDEPREAADAVAAHLRLRPVRVVNAHGQVGVADRGQRKDDAVAADAEVAVAEARGLVGGEDRFRRVAVVDLGEEGGGRCGWGTGVCVGGGLRDGWAGACWQGQQAPGRRGCWCAACRRLGSAARGRHAAGPMGVSRACTRRAWERSRPRQARARRLDGLPALRDVPARAGPAYAPG